MRWGNLQILHKAKPISVINSAAIFFWKRPFTAVGLSFVDFDIGNLRVDDLTAPGLVACLLSIVNFLLVLLFVEHPGMFIYSFI